MSDIDEMLVRLSHYPMGRDHGSMVFMQYWKLGISVKWITLDWYGLTWVVG